MSLDSVIHSYSYAIGFLNEQVSGIVGADLTRQPAGVPNHPAWTIGHLVFIAQAIGVEAGDGLTRDGEIVRVKWAAEGLLYRSARWFNYGLPSEAKFSAERR